MNEIKMKNKKKKAIVVNHEKENLLNKGRITHCPACGVDLAGPRSCASINCPCAPRITCWDKA